ncbi:MAG TPA: cytochrome d ubiquinol oxidase subunit II [Solirubrobacteraceae bacterium]|nr:cytochrome d ubiquinol oxidase subunit II [Solirubrobacteraceae bacterium]
MHLYSIPLIFILIGLTLYVVLGGADFGAGIWQLTAGSGQEAERLRDHAHDSMAPVWEANHVWLIFVLTVLWTAYPSAFESIASTLSVPLFLAAIGIVFRGATYALRSGARAGRETRAIDVVFALASLLTPFALGAAAGGIASRRVPVGNAAGHLFSSWLNPTSVMIGALAVATAAYMAAVFLAADAVRIGDADCERAFRARALLAGGVAGALALGGLVVVHGDAHFLYRPLVTGSGLPALIVSALAGIGTFTLVLARRYEPARYTAALAVAAIIAGWALAQQPLLLRGLTIHQAAAPQATLVLVVIAVLAGGALLFPSLALLFRLVLSGRVGHGPAGEQDAGEIGPRALVAALKSGVAARAAIMCLVAGFGLLTLADAQWTHVIGVVALLAFVVFGFAAVAPAELAAADDPD